MELSNTLSSKEKKKRENNSVDMFKHCLNYPRKDFVAEDIVLVVKFLSKSDEFNIIKK